MNQAVGTWPSEQLCTQPAVMRCRDAAVASGSAAKSPRVHAASVLRHGDQRWFIVLFTHKVRGKTILYFAGSIHQRRSLRTNAGIWGLEMNPEWLQEGLFQPINRIQGNYYVPMEEAASCQICWVGSGDQAQTRLRKTHIHPWAHTRTLAYLLNPHTAHTHAWLSSLHKKGILASESIGFCFSF